MSMTENNAVENNELKNEETQPAETSAQPTEEHYPLVSILIPVYKTELFLEECLDSLVNQTLKDIEIVCVNDGSPDNSEAILKRYAEADPRIVIVNKKNGGLPSARNAGLDVAKGKYVGFVDSDDYVQPNMFERLYQAAEEKDCEVVICGANIYPQNPAPNDWLKQVLSPADKVYRSFTPDLIFYDPSSRPFIWRTFIKRDLIERNHLRLQEDILVGEDNAFQFRLYPLAKGVALISDKLYNYRWYREGSMMNSGVYTDMTKRVTSHVKLVEHIAQKWLEMNEMCKMEYEFLKWSVEFLYDDFIKAPLNVRIALAKELVPIWEQCAYYINKPVLPIYITDMFEYFIECAEETEMTPKLSVIIPVGTETEFFIKNVRDILNQSLHDIEIIFINNGASDDTYASMHKFFHMDKRIRMFNQGRKSLAETLNQGVFLADSPYVTFMLPNDWYINSNVLQRWYDKITSNDFDVCGSIHQVRNSRHYSPSVVALKDKRQFDDYYLESDYKNVLYKKEFLQKNNIQFVDYSIFTGVSFLAKVYSKVEKRVFINDVLYSHRFRSSEIMLETEECAKVLDCIISMLELSIETQDYKLHTKAAAMLNDEYLLKLILNNTKPYVMTEEQCPNGENSRIEIWERMLYICSLISPELTAKSDHAQDMAALPHIMYRFINERHKFLSDMSIRYKDI